MGFLQDRRVLVTGMLSNRSIATASPRRASARAPSSPSPYQGEGVRDRVVELAREFGSDLVFPCDVADDTQIDALFAELGKRWDGLDGLVHAIAFAPRESLKGPFHESVSREAFRIAHDVSSYSLAALARAAAPMMQGRKCAIVTLSYLGAVRSIPNYNVMGLAKASLEPPCATSPRASGPRAPG
jgi:enoyl-[acyl-carrier protein] reductase I